MTPTAHCDDDSQQKRQLVLTFFMRSLGELVSTFFTSYLGELLPSGGGACHKNAHYIIHCGHIHPKDDFHLMASDGNHLLKGIHCFVLPWLDQ